MWIKEKFKKKSNMEIGQSLKNNEYSLLETLSILKYETYLNNEGYRDIVIDCINQLITLVDDFSSMNKSTSKDTCMKLSFKLGVFCNEFNNICIKFNLINPLIKLELNEIITELVTLKQIDKKYFVKRIFDFDVENDDLNKDNDYFRIYDTLFYLKNYNSINTNELIDIDLNQLKNLIKNRESSKENEDIAYNVGALIESLSAVAEECNLPNRLKRPFDMNFTELLDVLGKTFEQMERFNSNKVGYEDTELNLA